MGQGACEESPRRVWLEGVKNSRATIRRWISHEKYGYRSNDATTSFTGIKADRRRNQIRVTTNYRWQVKNDQQPRLTTWKARSRASRTREMFWKKGGEGDSIVMRGETRRASRRKERRRRMKGRRREGRERRGIETSHRPYTLHQSSLLAERTNDVAAER